MEQPLMACPWETSCKARPLSSKVQPVQPQQRPSRQPTNRSMNGNLCRLFNDEADAGNPLISPGHCTGSLRYVHQACLKRSINSDARCCELCHFDCIMDTKTKLIHLQKWRKLAMSSGEQRVVLWSVTFYVMVITHVLWSLYMQY
ncbi:hypothetical protein HPB48_008792 [Haemaphysalis longicornis]|uniref:RING-CH-type domain-containing protein n=1 Tax=Haemaphysalis longicornis TaxID=44386 RepID=A0A9J6H0G6_HAELO|nr:hypothetical protein HPB48_008792 [Haemaphysalis longicornis]